MEGEHFKKKEPIKLHYVWILVALTFGILIGSLWSQSTEEERFDKKFAEKIYTESETYTIGVGVMGINYTPPLNLPVACWVGDYPNQTQEYREFFDEVMRPLYAGSAVCFKTKDISSITENPEFFEVK